MNVREAITALDALTLPRGLKGEILSLVTPGGVTVASVSAVLITRHPTLNPNYLRNYTSTALYKLLREGRVTRAKGVRPSRFHALPSFSPYP